MSKFLYIASPYMHPLQRVRTERTQLVTAFTASLLEVGHCVFSPIAHGNACKAYMAKNEADISHGFWMKHDLNYLASSRGLLLFPLYGWKESKGVAQELGFCRGQALPIFVPSRMSVEQWWPWLDYSDLPQGAVEWDINKEPAL